MSDPRPTRKYNCTQAELYAICTIMWQSYAENQTDFEAFKTIYTAQYGIDAMQEVEDAKNLPDFQARNQATETAYINMGETAKNCLTAWRSLRSYIKSSFPDNLQKPEIEAAGEDHYNKATNRNWSETELMLVSAINYIDQHTALLTTGGMPATFQATLSNLHTEFMGFYTTFTDSGQDEHEGTDQKVIANNALYSKLQAMCEDGQIIYEHNAAKFQRFVFSRVKDLITSGSTGTGIPSDTIEFGLYAYDSDTLLPVSGATLTVINTPSGQPASVITDATGIAMARINGFQPNATVSLNMEASAPGYETELATADFTAGQYYSLDIPLSPQVIPPPQP